MIKTMEMRGMRRSDIVEYFIGIGGDQTDAVKISGPDWEVTVSEESVARLGSIGIPATNVTFIGEPEFIELMIAEFRLKFLSAGG
jgi:hypothetical protein